MIKKKAFTLIETLISSEIFAFIAIIGLMIISAITFSLFTGKVEITNRSTLNETVFYITREVQSAEGIKITDNGKCLKIKERGHDGYNLEYFITENYPTDYLAFKGKRLLDIDAVKSKFCFEGELVRIELYAVQNNIETDQRTKPFVFKVKPRASYIAEEE